jgi:hypothetical protein
MSAIVPTVRGISTIREHTGQMADEWNEQLRCPNCGTTGIAALYQGKGDNTPAVRGVSDGFRVVQTDYGPDFHCGACDVPVEL